MASYAHYSSQVNNLTTLYGYYQSAYAAVRAYSTDCFVIIAPRTWEVDTGPTSPSTPTPGSWQTFMSNSSYTKVLLDLHKCAVTLILYLCWTALECNQDLQSF